MEMSEKRRLPQQIHRFPAQRYKVSFARDHTRQDFSFFPEFRRWVDLEFGALIFYPSSHLHFGKCQIVIICKINITIKNIVQKYYLNVNTLI